MKLLPIGLVCGHWQRVRVQRGAREHEGCYDSSVVAHGGGRECYNYNYNASLR